MKLWIQYLIGALFGAAFAFILPLGNEQVAAAVSFVTEIVVRFGRYMVVPVVFFTAVIAFNRLRDTKMLFKTGIWTGGVIVASSLLLTVTGLLSILIVKLPRIPITVETVSESASLGVGDLIKSLLPYSAFETLNNGSFILAAFFFAMLVGTASTADPVLFKPVTQLADSLSKLMYNISVIFTEFLSVGLVAVLCSWTIQFRGVLTSGVFAPLILMLLVDFIFIAGVVYPLIIRYLCHDPHP